MITQNIHSTVAGEFRAVITRADGSVEDTGWFKNLVLDQGLDMIGSDIGSYYMLYACVVGTGTSAPAAGQTALEAPIGSPASPPTNSSYVNNGVADGYSGTNQRTYTFAQGSIVGTITEVGITNNSGALFSRALILDGSGTPTSISVTSIDQLTMYYRLKVYPQLTDTTGSVTISGTTYGYTSRPTYVEYGGQVPSTGGYNYVTAYAPGVTLNPVTAQQPNGSSVGSAAFGWGAYTTGTYHRDYGGTFSITDVVEPLQGLWAQNSLNSGVQIVLSAPIPKDNTKTLSLTLRFSWGRV